MLLESLDERLHHRHSSDGHAPQHEETSGSCDIELLRLLVFRGDERCGEYEERQGTQDV